MKRRKFVKTSLAGIVAASTLNGLEILSAQDNLPDAVWIENGEPEQLLQSALKEIGGLKRFISKGDVVVINIDTDCDEQVIEQKEVRQLRNNDEDHEQSFLQKCFGFCSKFSNFNFWNKIKSRN